MTQIGLQPAPSVVRNYQTPSHTVTPSKAEGSHYVQGSISEMSRLRST